MDLTKPAKPKKATVMKTPQQEASVQPIPQDYERVPIPHSDSDTAQVFVSKIRGLTLNLMRQVDPTNTDSGWHGVRIEFRDGVFTTDDDYLVSILKGHPSYGGSNLKGYGDRPPVARDPLYYHGSLPESVKQKMKEDSEGLTRDSTKYDDPYQEK